MCLSEDDQTYSKSSSESPLSSNTKDSVKGLQGIKLSVCLWASEVVKPGSPDSLGWSLDVFNPTVSLYSLMFTTCIRDSNIIYGPKMVNAAIFISSVFVL